MYDEEVEKLKKLDRAYVIRDGLKIPEKKRKIYITRKQFNFIQETINTINAADVDLEEATTTTNVGNIGDYTANGLALKTSDGKPDPCYKR